MKFVYTPDKDEVIKNHENRMLKTYFDIINGYKAAFEQYNCSLKVGCGWTNFLRKETLLHRLPFINGYECFIYCNIERNGEVIRYKEREVDYYEVCSSWSISSISRFFFHLNVTLWSDTDEVQKEIIRLLKRVESL